MLLISFALADTWAAAETGFAVPTREDAPTDAIVLYGANFTPITTVTDGPEAGTVLVVEGLAYGSSGNEPLVSVLPPEGGWVPASTYELTALGYYDPAQTYVFGFSTGADPAPPPEDPVVENVTYGEWTEETDYDWGCCHPTRRVTVAVESPSADPWAYVELMGQFVGPSQITSDLVYQRLAVAIGPGDHQLSYQQWDDDGQLQPAGFTVGHVASNGVRGDTTEVAGDGPPAATACGGDTAGCATAPAAGLLAVLLAISGTTRRRKRP